MIHCRHVIIETFWAQSGRKHTVNSGHAGRITSSVGAAFAVAKGCPGCCAVPFHKHQHLASKSFHSVKQYMNCAYWAAYSPSHSVHNKNKAVGTNTKT